MLNTLFPEQLPELFLFDMDHTLINNDCDLSWKEFLVSRGLAPKQSLSIAEKFYTDYLAGELNDDEFISFQLAEFEFHTRFEMERLALEHFKVVVSQKLYNAALQLIKEIQAVSIPIAIETATNSIVARPVAESFGITTLLATEVSEINGVFQPSIIGHYNCGEGKIISATSYCNEMGIDLSQVAYFGDSLSDIPLLSAVGYPVVTNGLEKMRNLANKRGWLQVTFKEKVE